MGRVPKKGLGVESDLGLGDTEAEPTPWFEGAEMGEEALFGFGLNEEALTFSRLLLAAVAAAVLEEAVAEPDTGVVGAFVETDPVADAVGIAPGGERDLPLNGGMD